MDTDNYAQPLEKVMREERRPRPRDGWHQQGAPDVICDEEDG